jgi:hypothetical protein
MAASAATQTPKPEQFDFTNDDDMHDAHDGTSKILAEQEQAVLQRNREVAKVVAKHLGPQASTAPQERHRRSRSSGLPMTVSQDEQQQPPPQPPPGATPIIRGGREGTEDDNN